MTSISFPFNKGFFPATAKNDIGSGLPNLGPYIIAPSYVKIPHVQIDYLIIDTFQRAALAKNLIIIGCGLRTEDRVLWTMITHFLNILYLLDKDNKNKKIIIIDPHAKYIAQRIHNHFGHFINPNKKKPEIIKINSCFNKEASESLTAYLNPIPPTR